jgi:hypothetical protein
MNLGKYGKPIKECQEERKKYFNVVLKIRTCPRFFTSPSGRNYNRCLFAEVLNKEGSKCCATKN